MPQPADRSLVRDLYRAAAGSIGLFVVAMQYFLLVDGTSLPEFLTATVHFFSYFTILSNILAAAALLVPLVAPNSALGLFLARPSVRTAITGYIIVVGVVYYLLLRNLGHAQGWTLIFERALHYLTPPLFVLDWLLFVPKRAVGWTVGMLSLAFPLLYLAWTLAHGALTGWYPYPFLDVSELGYPRALVNIAGLTLAFLALELVLVGSGRALGRVRHSARLS